MAARIMGIVNVTPDSFSDGGEFLDAQSAIAHGRQLAAEGADVLDIGGESTRPGAEGVTAEEELARVGPVVAALASDAGPPVSIDTSKFAVAEAALGAGATMVNDVTALRGDPDLAGLCAQRQCEVVLMHMLGDPRTMQENPVYEDVVDEIKAFLAERIEFALAEGIEEERIWIDPGIGFGKNVEHNLELHRRLGEFVDLGRPIMFGSSRKSFIGKLTGAEVDQRLGGTIASNVIAYANGASMLRVHDVAPMRQALTMADAILDPDRAAAIADRSPGG
jgi:dihydropteroate synthase